MASAMRKIGVYLGLVDEDPARYQQGAYEEYEEYPAEASDDGYTDGHGSADRRPVDITDDARPMAPVGRVVAPVGAGAKRPATTASAAAWAAAPAESMRITTLHPRTYNDARTIGEEFRGGTPVIMNLTEMPDGDAKRIVDFAAGLVFGLRGTLERVTSKVFLLSPANVDVGPETRASIAENGFFNQS